VVSLQQGGSFETRLLRGILAPSPAECN